MLFIERARSDLRALAAWAVHWWQFTSVKLAVVAGIIEGLRSSYPDQYAQLLDMVPEHIRPFIGALVMGAALWARTHPQPGIKPKGDGQ
jgi:hypothetical protein